MRKLALKDEILLTVQQPARYIGGEVNMVKKDPSAVDVRFAMCFPDVYEIGMSHLGIQILYSMFNSREDIYCERVYSPWMDLDPIMREKNIPLFTLETQEPVKNFDFLGITLQYEMCYTNVLQILDLAQIPLHAADRGEDMPIVIGGGPCAYNPEPLADFFDMFYIGEGETVYFELLDCYKENKKNGGSRRDFLEKAAQIEGIYVPAFYDVEYNEDGTLKPNQEYKAGENGYTYKTDANGNISSAHADELKFKTHDGRLNHNSNTAGKLPGDDAGHLFADQFGGSPDLDNLVSQRSDLNRAVKNTDNYRSMEREWSNALKNGQNVTDVDIKLSYKNGSSRPSSFNVSYKIDGELFRRIFKQ